MDELMLLLGHFYKALRIEQGQEIGDWRLGET